MALLVLHLYLLFVLTCTCSVSSTATVSRTVTVDKHGGGDYTTIKSAVDSVITEGSSSSSSWTVIKIRAGTYTEKIRVQKPNIVFQGEGMHQTTIQYGDGGSVQDSPTIKFLADNFVARNITFKNTYNHFGSKRSMTQAPAASVSGDKASFYGCGFVGLQDTLNDNVGRHYFRDCYIEGAVDFIWGFGQSIYESCSIVSNNWQLKSRGGCITAQGRMSKEDPTGFVFKGCRISGSGPIWLGRNYRAYSRVLFAYSYMENIIVPQGWSPEMNVTFKDLTEYSEVNCKGPGSDMSKRVTWMKKLSDAQVNYFTTRSSFIDADRWLRNQPN